MEAMEIMRLMATSDEAASGILALFLSIGVFGYLIAMAISIVVIIAEWKLFVKAGEPGWAILIPFYNMYTLYKIIYGNGWKFLFTFVPILGSVFSIAVSVREALCFGKDIGFGILNVFFTPVTICILGFGDAVYQGPTDSFL